jgi:CRISPR/Cas system-associated exonuclease Cas4 (RecB family)
MSKPKTWSYSQLSGYEKCAHAHMYRKVIKLPEPPSYHMTKGNAVHSLAEDYLLGKHETLPPVLGKFRREFKSLLDKGAIPEEEIVLDKEWQLIENGWAHKDAWLRLKLDARIGNYIVDFKTGRVYEEHINQGRLYANVCMMLNPEYDEVDVEFWYLNSGVVLGHTFYRKDLFDDIGNWINRVNKLHTDTDYTPTPHEYCKYCYVKHLCNSYE